MANLGLLTTKVALQSLLHHSVLTMYYHTDILVHFSLDVLQLFEHACMQKSVKQNKKKQGSSSFFRVIAVSRAARAAHALARACSCICACAYVYAYGGSCFPAPAAFCFPAPAAFCFPAPAAFCFLAKPQLSEFDWTDCTDLHKRTFCVSLCSTNHWVVKQKLLGLAR